MLRKAVRKAIKRLTGFLGAGMLVVLTLRAQSLQADDAYTVRMREHWQQTLRQRQNYGRPGWTSQEIAQRAQAATSLRYSNYFAPQGVRMSDIGMLRSAIGWDLRRRDEAILGANMAVNHNIGLINQTGSNAESVLKRVDVTSKDSYQYTMSELTANLDTLGRVKSSLHSEIAPILSQSLVIPYAEPDVYQYQKTVLLPDRLQSLQSVSDYAGTLHTSIRGRQDAVYDARYLYESDHAGNVVMGWFKLYATVMTGFVIGPALGASSAGPSSIFSKGLSTLKLGGDLAKNIARTGWGDSAARTVGGYTQYIDMASFGMDMAKTRGLMPTSIARSGNMIEAVANTGRFVSNWTYLLGSAGVGGNTMQKIGTVSNFVGSIPGTSQESLHLHGRPLGYVTAGARLFSSGVEVAQALGANFSPNLQRATAISKIPVAVLDIASMYSNTKATSRAWSADPKTPISFADTAKDLYQRPLTMMLTRAQELVEGGAAIAGSKTVAPTVRPYFTTLRRFSETYEDDLYKERMKSPESETKMLALRYMQNALLSGKIPNPADFRLTAVSEALAFQRAREAQKLVVPDFKVTAEREWATVKSLLGEGEANRYNNSSNSLPNQRQPSPVERVLAPFPLPPLFPNSPTRIVPLPQGGR